MSHWWFVPSGVLVLQVLRYLTRQRDPRWLDPRPTRAAAPTDVHLVGGPWPERTVIVMGMPAVGVVLSSETWGLGDADSYHGDYIVTALQPDSGQAVATWRYVERLD